MDWQGLALGSFALGTSSRSNRFQTLAKQREFAALASSLHRHLMDGLRRLTTISGSRLRASRQSQSTAHQRRSTKPVAQRPYRLFDLAIDTEWRSDMKWQRIQGDLPPQAERVLDVGCGSGYHLWRLREKGYDSVLGIDLRCCLPASLRGSRIIFGIPRFSFGRFRWNPCRPADTSIWCSAWACCITDGHRSITLPSYETNAAPAALCCLRPWSSKGTNIRCWCRRIVMRACETAGSFRRSRRWFNGVYGRGLLRLSASMLTGPPRKSSAVHRGAARKA